MHPNPIVVNPSLVRQMHFQYAPIHVLSVPARACIFLLSLSLSLSLSLFSFQVDFPSLKFQPRVSSVELSECHPECGMLIDATHFSE